MEVLYLGLVMTAFGYALWYHLLGRNDVNQVMPFLLLLPVTAVAGGVLFLDETLTSNIVAGGALAIGGVAIINLWPSRPGKSLGARGKEKNVIDQD